MSEGKTIRISKVLKDVNISLSTAAEELKKHKNIEIDESPNTKISEEAYQFLLNKFSADKSKRAVSKEIVEDKRKEREAIRIEQEKENQEKRRQQEQEVIKAKGHLAGLKPVGKIDLDGGKSTAEKPAVAAPAPTPAETVTPTATDAPTAAAPTKKEEVPTSDSSAKKGHKEGKEKDKKKDKEKDRNQAAQKNKTVYQNPLIQPVAPPKKKENALKHKEEYTPEAPIGIIETQYQKLTGPKVVGEKIDLSQFEKKKKKKKRSRGKDKEKDAQTTTVANAANDSEKRKRKRIRKDEPNAAAAGKGESAKKEKKAKIFAKIEPTEEEVQKQVRETLERLQGKTTKSKGAKYRKEKRETHRQKVEQELAEQEQQEKILKLTEFVTVNELATMMDVPINRVIGACMTLGIMVTMNQRLDAETLSIVADEFGFEVEFATANIEEAIHIEEDKPEDLVPRAPIVTVMGHVDHGKTSLLDHIRNTNVIAGEAGGITQHIGAYSVTLKSGRKVTFLDTPGHEAFTAMRARGTQATDIAIIIIAADDSVMPTTKEAIAHAQAAGVPMVFAINKIDKPGANPDKIREDLSQMNLLVEEWGGKFQCQEISAKKGLGVADLLDKVLLEADMLDLKANPNRNATGTVIESSLDKGRGYVSTVLVSNGTLKVGDNMIAGTSWGRIKAMFNERNQRVEKAGPSEPVIILGLNGAPTAGDTFHVMETEQEARDIANKREQLQREQGLRTQTRLTLSDISHRIARGEFHEMNIIVKGDTDGSIEALADSFIKLSTEKVNVNVISKAVGQISENDVMLAAASDAVIVGFQVRPSADARKLADRDGVEINTYSVIYDAIDDVTSAMVGMLDKVKKEIVTGQVEVQQVFKISKVGTVAGCIVTEGKVHSKDKGRVIRDGIVIHTAPISALKRYKDDVKEVVTGLECGISLVNYNDLQTGDMIETFTEIEVEQKL